MGIPGGPAIYRLGGLRWCGVKESLSIVIAEAGDYGDAAETLSMRVTQERGYWGRIDRRTWGIGIWYRLGIDTDIGHGLSIGIGIGLG
jgi:hypothetical protein